MDTEAYVQEMAKDRKGDGVTVTGKETTGCRGRRVMALHMWHSVLTAVLFLAVLHSQCLTLFLRG